MKVAMATLAIMVALPILGMTDTASAKRRGDDGSRTRFYGIVQSRPANSLHGEWVIGGHIYMTDAGTEFNQSEGRLAVGSCAKVDIRNGRVHEIDSEPMRNCR